MLDIGERQKTENPAINPIHYRCPLEQIKNQDDFHKAFDRGYPLWEKGEILRKKGNIQEAIALYDKARENGYDAPVLYSSYAKAYRKLQDYENEMDILNEGLYRKRSGMGKAWDELYAIPYARANRKSETEID